MRGDVMLRATAWSQQDAPDTPVAFAVLAGCETALAFECFHKMALVPETEFSFPVLLLYF
jgi:hypothetical protein